MKTGDLSAFATEGRGTNTLYEMLRQNRLYYTHVATDTRTSITFYNRRVRDR